MSYFSPAPPLKEKVEPEAAPGKFQRRGSFLEVELARDLQVMGRKFAVKSTSSGTIDSHFLSKNHDPKFTEVQYGAC